MGEKMNAYKLVWKTFKGGHNLGHLVVDGSLILKWLRIWSSDGLL
jgi:hypothetical protein